MNEQTEVAAIIRYVARRIDEAERDCYAVWTWLEETYHQPPDSVDVSLVNTGLHLGRALKRMRELARLLEVDLPDNL